MVDLRSDVLRTLRLQGTIYFHADFAVPWGMDFRRGSEFAFAKAFKRTLYIGPGAFRRTHATR